MNNQEAFDRVCRHLKQQGARSVMDDGTNTCVYAGPNGMACAVGCLLPRELAEALDGLEDTAWSSISMMPYRYEDEGSNIEPDEVEIARAAIAHLQGVSDILLVELQYAHDSCKASDKPFWEQVRPRLFALAIEYELDLPPELQP